jgi:F0F1-type ATP synthase assembly protein I
MQKDKNYLLQYAGLASQLIVGLGLSAWIGLWIDKNLIKSIPLFVWLLPFIFIIATIIKVIKDTSK